MPRISDWPPERPPLPSYPEILADIERRSREEVARRDRRTRFLRIAHVCLWGGLFAAAAIGFMFF